MQKLLPFYCMFCHFPTKRNIEICEDCEKQLPWFHSTQVCQRCALPLSADINEAICGTCLNKPPSFDAIIPAFYYESPINTLITRFKFHELLAAGQLLAHLFFTQHYFSQSPELLISVPLHPKRIQKRGFNQSHELAKIFAQKLHIPLKGNWLERQVNTTAQSLLGRKQRLKNVKNAFIIKNYQGVIPSYVSIIDDVVTTGATVEQMAFLLKQAGVQRVEVWCMARKVG